MIAQRSVSLVGSPLVGAVGALGNVIVSSVDTLLETSAVLLENGAKQVVVWRMRMTQRRELLTLDTHSLCDIGLSREEALLEARKPFWQA